MNIQLQILGGAGIRAQGPDSATYVGLASRQFFLELSQILKKQLLTLRALVFQPSSPGLIETPHSSLRDFRADRLRTSVRLQSSSLSPTFKFQPAAPDVHLADSGNHSAELLCSLGWAKQIFPSNRLDFFHSNIKAIFGLLRFRV